MHFVPLSSQPPSTKCNDSSLFISPYISYLVLELHRDGLTQYILFPDLVFRVFSVVLQQTVFCLASNFPHFNSESGMHSESSVNMRLTLSISLLLGITYALVHFLWEADAKTGLDMQKMYGRKGLWGMPGGSQRRQGVHQTVMQVLSLWRKREGRRAVQENKCQALEKLYESFSQGYEESLRQSCPLEDSSISAIITH